MTITVSAVYEKGVLKLEEPVQLEELARVRVVIEAPAPELPALPEDDPTGWKAIDALRGIVKGAPPDASEKHDKYLYGEAEE